MFHVEHLRLLECEAKKNLVTLFHVDQELDSPASQRARSTTLVARMTLDVSSDLRFTWNTEEGATLFHVEQ
jgi:hypothetical protein